MARALMMTRRFGVALCFTATTVFCSANAADPAKGADNFKKMCATCHTIENGAGNGALGPNLFGVPGRAAALAPKFGYSPALKASAIVWSDDKLKAWVQNPQKIVPGAKMMLIHAPNAEQADDIVAYLNTKK
jgi:cytochrome c